MQDTPQSNTEESRYVEVRSGSDALSFAKPRADANGAAHERNLRDGKAFDCTEFGTNTEDSMWA